MGHRQEPNAGSCTSAGCEQWQVLPLVAISDVLMMLCMMMIMMMIMVVIMMMIMMMIMIMIMMMIMVMMMMMIMIIMHIACFIRLSDGEVEVLPNAVKSYGAISEKVSTRMKKNSFV